MAARRGFTTIKADACYCPLFFYTSYQVCCKRSLGFVFFSFSSGLTILVWQLNMIFCRYTAVSQTGSGLFFITLNTWIEKWVNILMFLNKAKDSLDFATLHTLCYKPIPPYFCLLRCGAKWFPPIYTYISTFVCFTEKSSNTKKGRENTNRHVKTYVLKFQDLTDLKIKQ